MRPGSPNTRGVLTLSAVLLLAACSTSGQAGTSTQPGASVSVRFGNPYKNLDPNAASCKLLTQAEVEAALTQTLDTPTGTDSPRAECHYVNGAGFGLTVEIIHSANALADLATRKKEHEPRVSDLPGVGEAAYVTTGRRIIEFVKGQTIINLYTESRNDIMTPDEFTALAKAAEARVQ
jgi:hypothetical protein